MQTCPLNQAWCTLLLCWVLTVLSAELPYRIVLDNTKRTLLRWSTGVKLISCWMNVMSSKQVGKVLKIVFWTCTAWLRLTPSNRFLCSASGARNRSPAHELHWGLRVDARNLFGTWHDLKRWLPGRDKGLSLSKVVSMIVFLFRASTNPFESLIVCEQRHRPSSLVASCCTSSTWSQHVTIHEHCKQ